MLSFLSAQYTTLHAELPARPLTAEQAPFSNTILLSYNHSETLFFCPICPQNLSVSCLFFEDEQLNRCYK